MSTMNGRIVIEMLPGESAADLARRYPALFEATSDGAVFRNSSGVVNLTIVRHEGPLKRPARVNTGFRPVRDYSQPSVLWAMKGMR